MLDHNDKPITRYDCGQCVARTEVLNVKAYVSKVDNRMWMILVLVLGNLIATLVK